MGHRNDHEFWRKWRSAQLLDCVSVDTNTNVERPREIEVLTESVVVCLNFYSRTGGVSIGLLLSFDVAVGALGEEHGVVSGLGHLVLEAQMILFLIHLSLWAFGL